MGRYCCLHPLLFLLCSWPAFAIYFYTKLLYLDSLLSLTGMLAVQLVSCKVLSSCVSTRRHHHPVDKDIERRIFITLVVSS